MSYLNPPYENNFKELCAAMPLFYLDVYEMREILKTEGRLLDGVCGSFETIIADNFISTADAATLRLWEAALGTTYEKTLTLEQRRSVVLARIIGNGHIGEPEIREIIGQYTDISPKVGFAKGIITIVIYEEVFDEANMLDTLLRRIPAHLALVMNVHIRREFRYDLNISHGGALGSNFVFEPEAAEHISSTKPLYMAQAAFAQADTRSAYPDGYVKAIRKQNVALAVFVQPEISGAYPDGYIRAESTQNVAQAAFLQPVAQTDTPDVKRAETGRTDRAGGIFYHTHTKSRLIE